MFHLRQVIAVALLGAAGAFAQRRPLDPDTLAQFREAETRRTQFVLESVQAAKARLGLGDAHSLQLRSAFTDQYGRLHARFRQQYKGVRVMSGGVVAHLDEQERFTEPTAKLFTDIDLDVTPAVDAEAARQAVATKIAEQETVGLPSPALQAELVIWPQRRLVVFNEDPSKRLLPAVPAMDEYAWTTMGYLLAYLVRSSTDESAGDDREPAAWLVDAMTGAVLRKYSLRADDTVRTASQGSAQTFSYGTVQIATSVNEDTLQFELTDVARGGNTVSNLNSQTSVKKANAQPFTNGTNNWGDGKRYAAVNGTASANGQTVAVDVAYGVERTWDMLRNVFGHSGLDAHGTAVDTRVHYGANSSDAFWHRTAKAAFFGSGTATGAPPTDLETVAHELGHGVWYSMIESEGGPDSEADGISQGSADIFASLVEFYHLGSRGRGSALADVETSWNWRARMVNPPSVSFQPAGSAPQPGLVYWTVNAPSQEEHAVGTIYGHLFVLLARGASNNPSSPMNSRFFPNGMAGIGLQAAAEVWYVATMAYLPDEPTFFDLRAAFTQAAADLYGSGSVVYAGVLNAFAAAGMGPRVVDLSPPVVTGLTIQSLDEGEGSMLVSVQATDDTGVLLVEFQVDGQTVLTRQRQPYTAYVDVSKLGMGTHTLLVRALDFANTVGFTSQPFPIKGVNQLVSDPGFEDGGSKWNATAGVIRTGGGDAFLGARYAGFAGNGFISQRVAIGAAATDVTLAFRVRVDNDSSFATGARLEAQVRDEQGNLLQILNTYFDNANTQDTVANNYIKQSFSLNAYRGRTVELRFVATSPAGTVRFRIDNVNVVSVEPLSVEAAADVDEGEGSLILRLKSLSGTRPGQVARVDYLSGSDVLASSTMDPFTVVMSTQGLIRRTYPLSAALYDLGGGKLIESPSASFTVGFVNQLITNGGFETGATGWTTVGQTSFPRDTDVGAPTAKAFLGARYALLAGKGAAHADEMSQLVTIPEEATQATLSFRVRVDSTDRVAMADTLTVRLFDPVGFRLADLASYDNLYNTKGAGSANGYLKRTFDLTPYLGKQVRVHFLGRENTGGPTSFLIDGVSLVWK